ncbi:unnamed protein product [Alopecurus aequalis]
MEHDMYVNLEDGGGGGVKTAPDPGGVFSCSDGCMVACFGSIWVIAGIVLALALCCSSSMQDDDAASTTRGGCRCPRDLPVVAFFGGVFVAVGCAFWVCLALRFCYCCWSSGCMDRRHDGVLDILE